MAGDSTASSAPSCRSSASSAATAGGMGAGGSPADVSPGASAERSTGSTSSLRPMAPERLDAAPSASRRSRSSVACHIRQLGHLVEDARVVLGQPALLAEHKVLAEPLEVAQPNGEAEGLLAVGARPQLLVPREERPRRVDREEVGRDAVLGRRLERLLVLLLDRPLAVAVHPLQLPLLLAVAQLVRLHLRPRIEELDDGAQPPQQARFGR
eukprot:1746419-Prymnesium_polylepis.1